MGKKRKKEKKGVCHLCCSCIFYPEKSAGCKFPVKSMFLQLSKSLFFPEYTGQLACSKGGKAKRLGDGSERGIRRSSSSKEPILENGFPSDEFIYELQT